MKIRIAALVNDSIVDGPGLRYAVYTQGCTHHCKGCHNPQTHDPKGGRETDTGIIWREIEENPLLSGITFSGGDPLYPGNRETVARLAHKVRERFPKKTVWLYTGYRYEEIADLPLLSDVDVLVDGRFEADKRDVKLHWKGSSNQRVIDVQATKKAGEVVLHDTDYGKREGLPK